jgi:hypothetical protein
MSDLTIPKVRFTKSRAHVDVSLLLRREETESTRAFKQFLSVLDETAGVTWNRCNSLEGALLADDEDAHIYVALHLGDYERWCSDDPQEGVFSAPPHRVLWEVYQLGCQQGRQ